MKTIRFELDELTCPACIARIEGVLLRQKGVTQADVLFYASKVKITFKEWIISAEELIVLIENIGYPVLAAKVSVI